MLNHSHTRYCHTMKKGPAERSLLIQHHQFARGYSLSICISSERGTSNLKHVVRVRFIGPVYAPRAAIAASGATSTLLFKEKPLGFTCDRE